MWRHGGHQAEGTRRPRGKCTHQSPLLFRHSLKCLCFSVSIAEKVSNPLWAFPKAQLIPFRFQVLLKWSPRDFRRISQGVSAQIWAFPLHFPGSSVLLFIEIKNRRNNRNIKKPSAVLLLIMIYPTYHLQQTQTGATGESPLKNCCFGS